MIGQEIAGRYSVVRRLGGGGMGVVYQALDTLLGRDVAVKVLRSHLAEDEAFRRRFVREGRAAAALSHPNIVQVYDVGETPEGVPYIVMEYVEGETLQQRIARMGPLPEAEAADIAGQVAQALAEAHRRGIVHRDIKPLNILVTRDGRVKVADFGIARAATGATLVNTGTIVGSAHYVSPEQARGGYVDEKTDVYSLGVVLYEMLTGHTPFSGDTAIAVALKHLQEPVTPPSRHVPVSPAMEEIVLRALEKDPARRYASAQAMAQELERVKEQLAAAGTRGKGRHRVHRVGRMWPRVSMAAGGAVVLAAAGLVYARYAFPPQVAVPVLQGRPVATAQAALAAKGFRVRVAASQPSLAVAPGAVVRTVPPAGQKVRKGSTVVIIPSAGPPLVPGGVPDVRGQLLADAEQELRGMGLRVVQVLRRPSQVYAPGEVSATVPEPSTPIRQGQPVTLVVSTGASASTVTMPNLVGMGPAQWSSLLLRRGLVPSLVRYGLSQGPAGTVLGQSPSPGSVVGPGTPITLVVSPGTGGQSLKLPGVYQEQSATIALPAGLVPHTPVMVRVVSAAGTDVVLVTRAMPRQVLHVRYTWQGQGELQIWMGGRQTQSLALPVEAPRG